MMLWFDRHRRFRERLSAYIDGELDAGEAASVEAHVAACPACSRDLAELRAVAAALQGLPSAEPPRSFALTAADVAERAERRRRDIAVLNTRLRLASVGLAVALAVVVVVDMSGGGGEGREDGASALREMSYYEAMTAPESADEAGDDLGAAATALPTVPEAPSMGISWATPEGGGVEGGEVPAGGGTTGGEGMGGVSGVTPLPEAPAMGGEDTEQPASTPQPTPTPVATPTPAPAGLAMQADSGDREVVEGKAALGAAENRSEEGISAVWVIEVVLAMLLIISVLGAVVLTLAQRRRDQTRR